MASIRYNKLCSKLQKYGKIVIYGAGSVADEVYSNVSKKNVKVDYFVVTHCEGKKYIDGIKIYEVCEKEYELQQKNTMVLIAVKKQYENEIKQLLLRKSIYNYMVISEYDTKLEEWAQKPQIDTQEFLEGVAEYYFEMYGKELNKCAEITKHSGQYENRNHSTQKLIFVVGGYMPRVLKIAECLYDKGIKVILLESSYASYGDKYVKKKLLSYCDAFYQCNCFEELVIRILENSDAKIHFFLTRAFCMDAFVLIRMKKFFNKIVFETYDPLCEMYHSIDKKQLDMEKYCIENADGVCCRAYEIEYLKSRKDYHIKGKTIVFFDYCREDKDRESFPSSLELSLCYAGGIMTERMEPRHSSFACFLEFAELCRKNCCHFHVYCSYWEEGEDEQWEDYLQCEKENKYFHFHKPVLYSKLIDEIAQYDFGVWPVRENYKLKIVNGFYLKNKLIYTATNKIFDCLEAGLPYISKIPEKICSKLEKENMLISWAIEDFDFDELRRRKTEMRRNVLRNRNEYLIKNHIQELLDFYQSL